MSGYAGWLSMHLWGNWLQRRVLFLFIYFYLSRFLSSPSACRTSRGSKNRDYWVFLTFNLCTIALRALGSEYLWSCFFIYLIFIFFYTGQFCETDIDECIEDQPCQSGTCNNLKGGYECDCFENFCGTNCQRRDVCIVSTHQAMGPKNYWKIRHHALKLGPF